MAKLNYNLNQWAQQQLSSSNIPNDAFYDGIVNNYLLQVEKIRQRYDRAYGDIVVFGQGDCGQLGCGESVTEARRPRILAGLRGKNISQVACGGLHSVAVDDSGKVFTFGCNDEGSLGYNAGEVNEDGALPSSAITGFYPSEFGPNGRTPEMMDGNNQLIKFDKRKDEVITQVAAGDTVSLALSTTGNVYHWGGCKDNEGRLFRPMPPKDDTRKSTGFKDMNALEEDDDPKYYQPPRGNQDYPAHLVDLRKKAKDISAGGSFAAVLLEDDSIVTFGPGECGELGRTVPKLDKKTPMEIVKSKFMTPLPPLNFKQTVLSISCGGYHLLAVTRENGLSVYSTGLNQYGQLGLGDIENRQVLTKIKFFEGKDIAKVEGGLQFSYFVDKTGKELYSCGRGDYGQLGITLEEPDTGYGENVPCRVPLVYESNRGKVSNPKENSIILNDIVEEDQPEIVQISCGSTHALALTKNGDAYSWGFGTMGACGQGKDEADVLMPKKLEAKMKKSQGAASTYKIEYVSGGGQHSAALVTSSSLS